MSGQESGPPDFRSAFAALLPTPGKTIVIAVSGGADSMALWDLEFAQEATAADLAELLSGLRAKSSADVLARGRL